MQFRRLLQLGVLAATFLRAADASADATQADADKLQTNLTNWFIALLGPDPKGRTDLIDVVVEGDHFVVSDHPDPVNPADPASKPSQPHIYVTVKPVDATRWAILGVRLSLPNVPNGGATTPGDVTASGVLDPTLATASIFDMTLRNLTDLTRDDQKAEKSEFGPVSVHVEWSAATDGRVAMKWDFIADGVKTTHPPHDGVTEATTLGQLAVHTHMDGFRFAAAGTAVRALAALGRTNPPAAQSTPSTAHASPPMAVADRAAALVLVAAVRNLASAFDQEVTMTDMRSGTALETGAFKKLVVSIGGTAPNGDLAVHFAAAMDGFDAPQVPPGIIHDYLPRHVALAGNVTGIPVQSMFDLIARRIDQGDSGQVPFEEMAGGFLAATALRVGIDDVVVDMGPGHLTASGAVAVVSPATANVDCTVRLTGFDKIMDDANAHPEVKQAVPVLIFLKGLAHQDGGALIWNLSYKNNTFLVNGTDVSSIKH